MKTTKARGTPGCSPRRRLPGRGRWWQTWPAAGTQAAALLGLTLLAGGCSSSPATSGAATGGTTVADPLVRQGDEDLVNFARCMRAHGVQMSDPSDFGRQSPQFRSADTACRHLLPAGVTDNGTGP